MTQGFDLSPARPDMPVGEGSTIAPSAVFGHGVRLGANVHIGPHATIHDHVDIADGSFIGPSTSIGEPTMGFYTNRAAYVAKPTLIGAHAIIRTGTIINAGTTIGEGFQSGPHAAIRENTTIGAHVSVGNNCDVQYDVEIGDFCRLHSYVTIGSGSRIGPYVWLHPFVILTNDRLFPTFEVCEPPMIAPFCVLGAGCTVLPGTRLGVHVVAGSNCEIWGNVPAFSFLKGTPAERIIDARRMAHKIEGVIYQPYPWLRRVDRNYPWAGTPREQRRVEDWVPEAWKEFL
jgi:acetyltransferase-like isoleucine patch superfamily enzyme